MDAAKGASNTLLGQVGSMVFGKAQDKRQLKQQEKLNKLQIAGNKEMSEFERQQQMKLWNDTNYSAQVEQAKKAGMSISALYGGSGASGATTGGGAGMQVTGAQAGDPNDGTNMGMQLASQLALTKAQKENIEANTEKTKAETESTALGTDTGRKAQEDNLKTIKMNAEKAEEEMWIKANERTISDHTIQEEIRKIREEAINKILSNKGISIENRKKEAEVAIREFEANMAKSGISPNAPWYVKMMTDLADKHGLNILK